MAGPAPLTRKRFGRWAYLQHWVRWAGAGVPVAVSDCITIAEAGGQSQP